METLLLSPCPLLECCPSLRLSHTLALLSGEAHLMDSSFLFSLVTLLHRGILRCVILQHYGGGFGMPPWCVLVCSWRRQLADRHFLPFPWTLSLQTRRCPSASHHLVSFLSLLGLSFPLYFPFLSLGRFCQRSPRLSLFYCSVLGPHKGGQLPSPSARCVQLGIQYRQWGTPPQREGFRRGEGVNDFWSGQTVINTFSATSSTTSTALHHEAFTHGYPKLGVT